MEIITTHNNADFDALASMLGAHKLNPRAVPVLPQRVNRNVAEFLTLYRGGLPFVPFRDFRPHEWVRHLILTDTQRRPELRGLKPDTPLTIIDHHAPKETHDAPVTWAGDEIGAATTLLVEQLQQRPVTLTGLEITLLALGIYEDTGMLTYRGTTSRDIRAAAWLLDQGAALDTVRRFLTVPLNDEQQHLLENLLQNAETHSIQGHAVAVAVAHLDHHLHGINSVTQRLMNLLDLTALFVVVQMPEHVQLVCRATDDAVDVGAIAAALGGGGHMRAAAAAIHEAHATDIAERLWHEVRQRVQPAVRVADLMSYGVQTVSPDENVKELTPRIRRIGHEGYPVVENGQVIGLLTLRDADRAIEHGLGKMSVRDIMKGGQFTLSPADAVTALEQIIVNSGWGQIPVVENGQLLGIVTRTDLINHWARMHPAQQASASTLPAERIAAILGEANAQLIETIARAARDAHLKLYIVGGVVRDLLLERPNYDLDFVVEGDAIAFARQLVAREGGDMHSHRPFGTAKWLPDDPEGLLPHHIDFATARNEFYEHPTALPTVYSGSIKLDLGRRDFTINTLAVQLSPAGASGRILDFYNGLSDLDNRIIRVLHSLSFVDDPTRIIRAVRFSERLGFVIDPRTAELITTALPMLKRITGQRLRNELTLLLQEEHPARGLRKLQALGALEAIHPAFVLALDMPEHLAAVRRDHADALGPELDLSDLYWPTIFAPLPPEAVQAICERLGCKRQIVNSATDSAHLLRGDSVLRAAEVRPSALVRDLEKRHPLALKIAGSLLDERARQRLRQFEQWRNIHPVSDGHTLRGMNIPPGPIYKTLLDGLRDAWLNGDIAHEAEEKRWLQEHLQQMSSERESPDS